MKKAYEAYRPVEHPGVAPTLQLEPRFPNAAANAVTTDDVISVSKKTPNLRGAAHTLPHYAR